MFKQCVETNKNATHFTTEKTKHFSYRFLAHATLRSRKPAVAANISKTSRTFRRWKKSAWSVKETRESDEGVRPCVSSLQAYSPAAAAAPQPSASQCARVWFRPKTRRPERPPSPISFSLRRCLSSEVSVPVTGHYPHVKQPDETKQKQKSYFD